MKIKIKVIPGASSEGVQWFGELLKVKVRTAPEKGRANAAVEHLLASRLDVPASNVKVVSGFTQALKTVEIAGMDEEGLRKKIA